MEIGITFHIEIELKYFFCVEKSFNIFFHFFDLSTPRLRFCCRFAYTHSLRSRGEVGKAREIVRYGDDGEGSEEKRNNVFLTSFAAFSMEICEPQFSSQPIESAQAALHTIQLC